MEWRGWSRGCGWWRAGIRKTKQRNGKEKNDGQLSCSVFPRAGFAQAEVRAWIVVNGYFSSIISLYSPTIPCPHTPSGIGNSRPLTHTPGLCTDGRGRKGCF